LSKKRSRRAQQTRAVAATELEPPRHDAAALSQPVAIRFPRQGQTRGLTEGAILAALVAMLALAARYLPLLGIVATLLCPLPLAVLVIRHGLRTATIAGVVATLVAGTLGGPLVGLMILISFAPIGLILGIGAHRNWNPARIVLLGGLVSFVSTVLNYLGLMGGGRISMNEMTETMVRSTDMATNLYTRLGLSPEQISVATSQMHVAARMLPYLLPVALVFGALFAAWMNYEVGRRVLRRFGYALAALPPLRTWRIPAAAIWLVPVSYLLLVVGARAGATPIPTADVLLERFNASPPLFERLGTSLVITMQSLFTIQGVIAGWVILGNYGFGKFAQAMAIMMVFAVPVLGVAAFFLGVMDSTLKIRERWGLPRVKVTEEPVEAAS
jgi:uncharacterized protein YybS (DUF2232 family)